MIVTCRPTKEVFYNSETKFRVLACYPIGDSEVKLNKYNNFSISGTNISHIKLYEEYDFIIKENTSAKQEASYIVVGYPGIEVNDIIDVDPAFELKYLKTIMSYGQAVNVNTAYPNFIKMILNNEEDQIDFKLIDNVGPAYLEKYIEKIKSSYKTILFAGIANDWKITGESRIKALTDTYATPQECSEAINNNPYYVLVDVVGCGFNMADNKITEKMPEMIDSLERCEYACLKVIHDREFDYKDTRVNANVMYREVKDLVPEAVHNIVEAVQTSRWIHYDPETKYASAADTYSNELVIAQGITNRLAPENKIVYDMDWEKFKNVDGFDCTEEQTEILKLANEENVMLLVGGAGTGKSSSAKALVQMLYHNMKRCILLAPTGVAAKRLSETTGREAMTIHMFLARLADGEVSTDYVILDEFSMVGVELFARLIKKIGNSKLVLICDNAQLASISCGNVLQDMIDSELIPTAKLTKVFRYGIGEISTVVTDIRNGKMYLEKDGSPLFRSEKHDYNFVPISNSPIDQVVDIYGEYLEMGYKPNDIMVLCPFNKSTVGTYEINKAIQSRYNSHNYTNVCYDRDGYTIEFKVGDKVINTKNNYHMPSVDIGDDGGLVNTQNEISVMNGDIGYIRGVKEDEVLGKILTIEFDNGLGLVYGSSIEDLLLGYSMSIHKCQGSQAKVVIVVTDKIHRDMLSRNILYVATSRARELLTEIGKVSIIEEALEYEENKIRDTYLYDMLLSMNGKKKPVDGNMREED